MVGVIQRQVVGVIQRQVVGVIQRQVVGVIQRQVVGVIQRQVVGVIQRQVVGVIQRQVVGVIQRQVVGVIQRQVVGVIQCQVVGVKRMLNSEPPPLKRLCRSELSSFVFKLLCIFCGEIHSLKSDPCNPSRWRAAYLCKTASHGTGLLFKDSILEVCGRRKDAWANHAAEARYHDSYWKNFMPFQIKEANTYPSTSDTDLAFDKLVEDIISNKSNIWTSSEVHEKYLLHGGKGCRREAVFAKLQKHFDDQLVVSSAPGLSNFLVFRDTVPSVFKYVDDNDDDK